MNKISILFFMALVLTIVGCKTIEAERYGELDLSNKTIYVPSSNDGLCRALKRALRKDGWQVYVLDKSKVVTSGVSKKIDDTTTEYRSEAACVSNVRYSLFIEYDKMLPNNSVMRPEITIVDNNTGEEVLLISYDGMAGRAFYFSDVAELLIKAISGKLQ